MRNIFLIILAAASVTLAFADKEAKHRDFAFQALEAVWSEKLPAFENPPAVPSQFEDEPAVILVSHHNVTAKKKTAVGLSGLLTVPLLPVAKINMDEYLRQLIYINDPEVARQFSRFDIPISDGWGFGLAIEQNESKHAVGARVYRPDGSMEQFGAEDLIIYPDTINGEVVYRQKISIPDLKVGDMVEMVLFSHSTLKNIQPAQFVFNMRHGIPVVSQSVECKVDDDLTTVYHSVNGAPDLSMKQGDDKDYLLSATLDRPIEAEPMLFYSSSLQSPQIKIQIYNRRFDEKAPKFASHDGIIANPDAESTVVRDAVNDLEKKLSSNISFTSTGISVNNIKYVLSALEDQADIEALKMVKKKLKEGSWTERQAADYIYNFISFGHVAGEYVFDPKIAVLAFARACDNAGIKSIRPFITLSRDKGSFKNLVDWKDVDYGVYLPGENAFYLPSAEGFNSPNEIPAQYQGQEYVLTHDKNLKKEVREAEERHGLLPVSTPDDNRYALVQKVSFDGNRAVISRNLESNGATRNALQSLPTTKNLLDTYSAILSIDSVPVRKKLFVYSEEQRDLVQSIFYGQEEEQKDAVKQEIQSFHGSPIKELLDYQLLTAGIGKSVDNASVSYKANYTSDDILTDAGTYYILNLGKLMMSSPEIISEARKRSESDSLYFEYPSLITVTNVITVPEGYAPAEEAVKRLNKTVKNELGAYSIEAGFSNGRLAVTMRESREGKSAPATLWPQMLELLDAASASNDLNIALDKIEENKE